MYEILTHFIEPLSQAPNFQDFKLPESPEEELPKELEEYIGKVSKFTKAISEFVKNHPELELHNYYEILTAHDIETSAKAFTNLDLKEHDGITIMAILIFII
ncbi:MAG: hypothetical protein IJU40_00790, partial [Desulfovibrionaceae bacterium]|nr:hypothetical protein [Desulfovibrionaceae bacterium]